MDFSWFEHVGNIWDDVISQLNKVRYKGLPVFRHFDAGWVRGGCILFHEQRGEGKIRKKHRTLVSFLNRYESTIKNNHCC